jgi:hypothetical protein
VHCSRRNHAVAAIESGGGEGKTMRGGVTRPRFSLASPGKRMAVLIVIFDYSPAGASHYSMIRAIKKYPWAKLTDTSYAISTELTPQTVFTQLRSLMESACNLYVMTSRKPFAGFGPQSVNDWLQQN